MDAYVESWPAVGWEPRVWDWAGERPTARVDRLFRDYESARPPLICGQDVELSSTVVVALERASSAVAILDTSVGPLLSGVSSALLQSESVGSSRIEHLMTNARDLGLAAIGEMKLRSVAAQVWANVSAMERSVRLAESGSLGLASLLDVHRTLMVADPYEGAWAGKFREAQSWIGGSDSCPRDALFVPPVPELVEDLMVDLCGFIERVDVPVLAQAAIAHAQFETIHPFTDGNGRTGRALIHAIVRRRGLARQVVVPTSSALLADVDGYFESLGAYRQGDLDTYLLHIANATYRAATEASVMGRELDRLRTGWDQRIRQRTGSITGRLLDGLIRQPVISSTNHGAPGIDAAGFYRVVERLVAADVLTEMTSARRNRIWVATEVTSELDDFARRIGRRQSAR